MIDEQSINEGDNFKLKSIMFMPYMGSSYSNNINGYIFVPDGSGALIRFQKPASYSSGFAKKVYGKDLAIDTLADASDLKAYRSNDYIIQDPQILMPVYGMVHGDEQNAFLGVINSGAEYASIIANPAALNNPYNWGGVRFEYRQKFNLSTNRKEGSGAIVPQEARNMLSPSLTLHFLTGNNASYDKMAVYYRSILFKESVSDKTVCEIPLKLEVLGAATKNDFFKSTELFTTINNAENMAKVLNSNGITNISMVLRGFTKNNEAGYPLENKVGNKKDLQQLYAYMSKSGGGLYLHLDPLNANKDQINLRTEASNNLSNILINIKRSNPSIMYPDNYFYRLSEAEKRVTKAIKQSVGVPFAVDSLGYRLYGDYTTNNQYTRADNLENTQAIATSAASNGNIPFYQPNSYLWEHTSEFYDIPLVSSQYLFETDTVPFLQIVLSGKLDMFASSLNTGTFSKNRLLRMVEYGTYPSFTVTNSHSEKLYNTPFEDCFSTNFDDWTDSILQAYTFVQEALASVIGKSIIAHSAISEGFIDIEYSGNTTIYVNYTNKSITHDGITVQPYSYFVREG